MQNAQRKMEGYGRQMQKVGSTLTLGVTAPLVALGAVALKNYDVQAKAVAQVEQGLISTGNAVGYTTKQLEAQASALQNNSLFGDESILKNVTAQLLTFTNIAGEQFDRTQQAALDLATRLDGDLKSASIQLGKALNDPVLGLSALAKSGIQFSKDQKVMIKAMVEAGDIAKAQTLILDELEKQYGGSAAAAAKAGLGPLTQLKNIVGDITEEFGAIISEGIAPLIAYLKDVALRFQNLSPETKKFIVILGGVAAAVGPLLALAGTILPAIGTGLTLLTGPIGLIVAGLTAVGVIIYKNWEPIKGVLVDIANYFVDLYNESTIFRIAVEAITTAFKNIYDTGRFVFQVLGGLISEIASNIKNSFTSLGQIIKAVLTGNLKEIPSILANNFNESTKGVRGFVEEAKKNFGDLKENVSQNIAQGVENAIRGKKYTLLGNSVDTQELEDNVANAVTNGLQKGASGAGGPFTPQTEKVGLTFETQGVTNPLGSVAEQLTESTEGIKAALASTNKELTFFQENAQIVSDAVGNAFDSMTGRFVDSLNLADDGFQGFVKGLVGTITKLITMLLSQSIANAIAGATASGTATGPGAVFTTPAFIATAVGGVLAAFAAIPKFATGGIVGGNSFYGDKTLARVNSGELILNIAQQKNLAGALSSGNNITLQPSLRVEGDGIRVLLNRVENNRNRRT